MPTQQIQYDAAKHPNFKEFLWFKEHEAELLARHGGQYLLIKDGQVVGVFETRREAVREAFQRFEPGTFIVHHCIKKEPIKMVGNRWRQFESVTQPHA